jgi:hypothetical protein
MYIDPGTGSMIIQVLVAAIPVAAAVLIGFRNKIRLLFGKSAIKSKKKEDIPADIAGAKTDNFEEVENE